MAAKNVDDYISSQPTEIQGKLKQMRSVIKELAPKAEESISYMMPAYKMGGPLVYFAGCKSHVGFYPTGSGVKEFVKDLDGFKFSKGAIQFPLDKPLPITLIKKIVKFRLKENKVAAAVKAEKLKSKKIRK